MKERERKKTWHETPFFILLSCDSFSPFTPPSAFFHLLFLPSPSSLLGCNLNFSTEKNPRLVWLAHNFSRYDALITMRGILDHGIHQKITYYGHNDQTYTRSLLRGVPKALFRDKNEIISISIRFQCPFDAGLCSCKMTREERASELAANRRPKPCPFKRSVLMADSYLYLNFSLDTIIAEVNQAKEKENLSIQEVFPCTMRFLTHQKYTPSQIALLLKKKISIPYEALKNFQCLRQTSCPTPDQFKSVLRGTDGLSAQEMRDFQEIWTALKIPDLFSLLKLYVQMDSCQAADGIAYYYTKLFQACHLHPLHFLTVSSFSLAAAILNSADPHHARKKLFLPYLTQSVHELFTDRLIGGFAAAQAIFSKFNLGRITLPLSETEIKAEKEKVEKAKTEGRKKKIKPRDLTHNPLITKGKHHDMNALYGGSLQGFLPYDQFRRMDKIDKSVKFLFLCQQLMNLNFDFFQDQVETKRISYLFKVVVSYDLDNSVGHSVDLGPFPKLKSCILSELSKDQQNELLTSRQQGEHHRQPPKLVSVHEDNVELTDFIFNLIFLVTRQSLIIKSVESIVEFRVADVFSPWTQYLQKCRQKAVTNIESKLFKNLGQFIKCSHAFDVNLSVCLSVCLFHFHLSSHFSSVLSFFFFMIISPPPPPPPPKAIRYQENYINRFTNSCKLPLALPSVNLTSIFTILNSWISCF